MHEEKRPKCWSGCTAFGAKGLTICGRTGSVQLRQKTAWLVHLVCATNRWWAHERSQEGDAGRPEIGPIL
jgi:hypothetical protein